LVTLYSEDILLTRIFNISSYNAFAARNSTYLRVTAWDDPDCNGAKGADVHVYGPSDFPERIDLGGCLSISTSSACPSHYSAFFLENWKYGRGVYAVDLVAHTCYNIKTTSRSSRAHVVFFSLSQ